MSHLGAASSYSYDPTFQRTLTRSNSSKQRLWEARKAEIQQNSPRNQSDRLDYIHQQKKQLFAEREARRQARLPAQPVPSHPNDTSPPPAHRFVYQSHAAQLPPLSSHADHVQTNNQHQYHNHNHHRHHPNNNAPPPNPNSYNPASFAGPHRGRLSLPPPPQFMTPYEVEMQHNNQSQPPPQQHKQQQPVSTAVALNMATAQHAFSTHVHNHDQSHTTPQCDQHNKASTPPDNTKDNNDKHDDGEEEEHEKHQSSLPLHRGVVSASHVPPKADITDPIAKQSIEERTLSEFDHFFRQKNLLLSIITLIVISLQIIMLQLPWDGAVYDLKSSIIVIIQIFITLLTLFQLFRIYDYYQLLVLTDRIKFGLQNRDGILQSFRLKSLLIEMFVISLHSLPFIMYPYSGLFVFCRIYLWVRTIRDYSSVFRWRKKIIKHGKLSGLPEFDWWLTIRTYFHLYPWHFMVVFITLVILMFSYCIYILEREKQPLVFKFGNVVYFTCVTMTTLGYGDMTAQTDAGRALAMLCVLTGMIQSAMLITALLNSIQLSANQLQIAEFVADETMQVQEQHMAATLIQKAYRHYVSSKRESQHEGVDVMTVNDDGCKEVVSEEEKKKNIKGEFGVCGSCCGLYYKPPTHQDVLNQAKRNREYRYYRFLQDIQQPLPDESIQDLDTRMERIEDMMIMILEQLNTKRIAVQDDESAASSTQQSPRLDSNSNQESRTSHVSLPHTGEPHQRPRSRADFDHPRNPFNQNNK